MNHITKLPVIKTTQRRVLINTPKRFKTIRHSDLKTIKVDLLLIEKSSELSTTQNPYENPKENQRCKVLIKPREKISNYYLDQSQFKPKSQLIYERINQLNTEFKRASRLFNHKVLLGYTTLNHSKDSKFGEKNALNSYMYRKNINGIYDRLKEFKLKDQL